MFDYQSVFSNVENGTIEQSLDMFIWKCTQESSRKNMTINLFWRATPLFGVIMDESLGLQGCLKLLALQGETPHEFGVVNPWTSCKILCGISFRQIPRIKACMCQFIDPWTSWTWWTSWTCHFYHCSIPYSSPPTLSPVKHRETGRHCDLWGSQLPKKPEHGT